MLPRCGFMDTIEEETFLSLEMVSLFERNPTELCLIFTLDFIYQCHHHRLESYNYYFLQPPCLQRYADAVAGKGAFSYNRFDFVDGTIPRVYKPVLDKRGGYEATTQRYMI